MRTLGAILIALVLFGCGDDQLSVENLQKSLVVGMDRSEVDKFFEENDLAYSVIGRESALTSSEPIADDGVLRYRGIIRNTRRELLILTYSTSIVVDFDANDQVVGVNIHEVGTGP